MDLPLSEEMPGGGDSGALGAGNRISECLLRGRRSRLFLRSSSPRPPAPPPPTTSTPGAGRAHWFTEHVHLIASVLWTLLFSLPLCPRINFYLLLSNLAFSTTQMFSEDNNSAIKTMAILLLMPFGGKCFSECQLRFCQGWGRLPGACEQAF